MSLSSIRNRHDWLNQRPATRGQFHNGTCGAVRNLWLQEEVIQQLAFWCEKIMAMTIFMIFFFFFKQIFHNWYDLSEKKNGIHYLFELKLDSSTKSKLPQNPSYSYHRNRSHKESYLITLVTHKAPINFITHLTMIKNVSKTLVTRTSKSALYIPAHELLQKQQSIRLACRNTRVD